jgi:hypothetical protein
LYNNKDQRIFPIAKEQRLICVITFSHITPNSTARSQGIFIKRAVMLMRRCEDNEWKVPQKNDINNRASEARNIKQARNKTINKTSYFL